MPGGSFPIDIIAGSDGGGAGRAGWAEGCGGGMANWGWLGRLGCPGGGGNAPGGKPCGIRPTLTMAGSSGGAPTAETTTGMGGIGG